MIKPICLFGIAIGKQVGKTITMKIAKKRWSERQSLLMPPSSTEHAIELNTSQKSILREIRVWNTKNGRVIDEWNEPTRYKLKKMALAHHSHLVAHATFDKSDRVVYIRNTQTREFLEVALDSELSKGQESSLAKSLLADLSFAGKDDRLFIALNRRETGVRYRRPPKHTNKKDYIRNSLKMAGQNSRRHAQPMGRVFLWEQATRKLSSTRIYSKGAIPNVDEPDRKHRCFVSNSNNQGRQMISIWKTNDDQEPLVQLKI